jgi:type I restriction enzyme, S subunit
MNVVLKPTKLLEILKPISRPVAVDPLKEYPLLGIRLDGVGVFHRETKLGSQIAATTLFQVKTGDFIYSRLFAWRGAFGVIGHDLDGYYVSGEFPTFLPMHDNINIKFLQLWFRLPTVISKVEADCTGSTPLTRNRYKENFLLALEIPLPPLKEQNRIVARIEELSVKIEEARGLRLGMVEEAERNIGRSRISDMAG